MTRDEILTFLNGRAMLITVIHGPENGCVQEILWEPSIDISIEDATLKWIEDNDIDWEREVYPDGLEAGEV